jgi:hypothetical protein
MCIKLLTLTLLGVITPYSLSQRTDCFIVITPDFNIILPKEFKKGRFSKTNNIWFLCKTNLSRFALVGFNFLLPTRAMQTKFALLQRG